MNLRAASWMVVLSCFGCGSSTPPPAAPVQASTKSEAVAEPQPDLSPVAAPDDLILVGRLSRPRVLVDTIASWIGVPLRVTDLLPAELRSAESVVAWDAPVEIAGMLDRHSTSKMPAPVVTVSVGITSLPRALEVVKARGLSATRVAPGIHRIEIDDSVTCAVAAATGATSARLVCGGDWAGMEDLLPYATRGLPNEKLGSDDLHLELRAGPLQRRYAQEIAAVRLLTGLLLRQGQTDSPRVDRALTDAAYGLADELKALATDVEKLQITLRLDEGNKAVELGSSFAFAKSSSFTAQLMLDMAQRAAPAPESFWQLPRSAENAGYALGYDSKRLGPLASAGAELLDAYLEQQKGSAALRRRARDVVEALPLFFGAGVSAGGSLPAKDAAPSALGGIHQWLGWRVLVLDARPDKLTKFFVDLEAVAGDRWLKSQPGGWKDAKIRHRAARVPGFAGAGTMFSLTAPPSLFSGDEPQEPAGKKPPAEKAAVIGVVLLVPDGERTWISIAPDEKSAVAFLESTRSAPGGRLKGTPELASLDSAKSVSGGYMTLQSLLASLVASLKLRPSELAATFNRAPNRGLTPPLYRGEVVAAGEGVVARASWRFPRGVFEDLGSIGPFLMPKLDDKGD